MSLPQVVDFYGRQNETFRSILVITDAATGLPIDLTGVDLAADFKKPGDAADSPTISLATVTSDIQGLWIVDAINGVVWVKITQTTLKDITFTTGELDLTYDLKATLTNSDLIVFCEGVLHLVTGITQ